MQIIITEENKKLLSDVGLRCRRDLRYVTYQNCQSEEALRDGYGFGKSVLRTGKDRCDSKSHLSRPNENNKRSNELIKGSEAVNRRKKLIEKLKNIQNSIKGIEILPVGPFQAYELKGKYGNPDRPDQEGFAVIISNRECAEEEKESEQTTKQI